MVKNYEYGNRIRKIIWKKREIRNRRKIEKIRNSIFENGKIGNRKNRRIGTLKNVGKMGKIQKKI